MFTLPPPLHAMGRYSKFITYKLVPSATRPGKTDKWPVHPVSGEAPVNAHDPSIWMRWEDAAQLADRLGPDHGVGFVFTPDDPFWFLDIDSCIEDGQWSSTAQYMFQQFPGAATEISAGGKGVHLFGCGTVPRHKTRYDKWFEFYTDNRFCALTGTNATGDIWLDHSAACAKLVQDYLTPDAVTLPTAWTDGPCEGWRGSKDDDELIKRMKNSTSASQAFGGKIPFADLWDGNTDVIAKYFPPDPGGKSGPYNASSADISLAQTLSFWTGRDCERMLRLMKRSALVRDKWDREDYLPRTIQSANARQYDVCQDKEVQPVEVTQARPDSRKPALVTGSTYLNLEGQLNFFRGCVYVIHKHSILTPGGWLLNPERFRATFGGYTFVLDNENQRVTKNPWEAFIESQLFVAPKADRVCFRPELPPAEILTENGTKLVNIWWPIETPQADGDVTPFTIHLAKILPDEDDRAKLLAYMAACVQYPGRKFQWAPLLQGVEGNGKSFLADCVGYSIGDRYVHKPNPQDLSNKFNGWLEQKLFIILDEVKTNDRQELVETLKPLIGSDRIEIQAKGADQTTGDNRANFFACTNYKDALPKTTNDRRWAIFFSAQQEKEDLIRDGISGDYMPNLWTWAKSGGFAIINRYLRQYEIPAALNPAGAMHRAPQTTATVEAIALTAGTVEQEIIEAVEQGLPGFSGNWISTMMLDQLLQKRFHRNLSPRKRHEILRNLGYVPHPHLPDGRVTTSVAPDQGKPRLFIPKGHINGSITDPRMICQKYTAAQDAANVEKANFGVDGSVNKA